ncbi:MAG: phosphoglycerate dehydrogenase [Elusimicrobiota bacterium]|nr:phosphoglycerate dehydrogenase [Elusimicrobiota bacterium]
MNSLKVLISDALSEAGINILKENPIYEVDVKLGLSLDELKSIIRNYDALIIRSGTQVTEDIIKNADKLKIIGRAGVGIDNVDVTAASKRGIVVMNTPGGNTISAAEHTMSMMLALARNIPMADASLKNKEWKRSKFTGTEIYGKTLGVIGFGKIGFEVAKRARSFEMNVLVYDPFATEEQAEKLNAKIVDLDFLIKNSDFITLHIPKTKDTENLINKDSISKMKDGVRIINVARGGIINEQDLADAIKTGKVKGAAIDVFVSEPCLDSPLFDVSGVVVTPHLGASTEEAQINVAIDIVKQIRDYFENSEIKNAVNVSFFPAEILKQLKPFITLAEKIGILESTLLKDKSGIKEVEIRYAGDISEKSVSPITVGFLKGLLQSVEEHVNSVNASFFAKERGIKVKEIKVNKVDDIINLLTLKIKTNKEEILVSGTVFHEGNIRIIKINDYNVDLSPFGNIIISKNEDIPGVVGKLGTKLAEVGINISNMQVSTSKKDNKALMLTSIDKEISQYILEKLKNIKEIEQVQFIVL